MPQLTFDEIIEKYVEMNTSYPFRESNGRIIRIWPDCIFKKKIDKMLDWSKVDKEEHLLAMERSQLRILKSSISLKTLSLTKLTIALVYMNGIDHSYYKGYTTFKTEEL